LGIGKGGRDEEDAFGESLFLSLHLFVRELIVLIDMRKPLSRDATRRSVRSNGRDMIVSANAVN
jgi:N-terminal acetyltransferase B complex catalytic subunit